VVWEDGEGDLASYPIGVVVYRIKPPRPRHRRVQPLLDEEGSAIRVPLPTRRGGAQRRGGMAFRP
jgi:hypothetical protein